MTGAKTSNNGLNDFALARYNNDGSLDTTFGTDGKVTTDFDSIYSNDDYGNSIAIQPNGKIVVGGYSNGSGTSYFALARYNTNGSLDTTFNADGKEITNFNGNNAYKGVVALQSDGKIIIAVHSFDMNDDFALARYTSNGSLDSTFGTDGKVTTDFGGADKGNAIAIQSDGKILIAGSTDSVGGGYDFALARYLRDATPRIHYVKWNASGVNNGASWTNAYTDLQSALSAASSGDEIWVAAGTYKPTSGTDRAISFALKNAVAIYGGFDGTETLRTQRNHTTNVTVLSGEIGVGGIEDNSGHVVTGGGTNNTALLDGFTITEGNANGPFPHDGGGGMYNDNGSPTLTNLIFSNNSATYGGGVYNRYSEPSLTNITFNDNSGGIGTGMHNYNSSPNLLNVTFSNNWGTPGSRGGAMVNDLNSSPNLTNVTFINNSVVYIGGGMSNSYDSNPNLVNVTFIGNSAGV